MPSFELNFIERQPITQNLLRTIRLIGEYKGKQELFKQQSPQVLETLQHTAIIQSTESSILQQYHCQLWGAFIIPATTGYTGDSSMNTGNTTTGGG